MSRFEEILQELERSGNRRRLPAAESDAGIVDLSSNDYLGLGTDIALRKEFYAQPEVGGLMLSASASRLLAGAQDEFYRLESTLERLYGRPALLYNSGYHVNTGIIPAIADAIPGTVVVADKLVHASIIDGIRLSGSKFERFRHNNLNHLETLLMRHADAPCIIVAVESVYSMDGDSPDLESLIALKQRWPQMLLYVDEAHGVGVCGADGLGLAAHLEGVDILIGTYGKALASVGAFAILADESLKQFLINRSRPLIFSTALPPLNIAWSRFVMERLAGMEPRRQHLRALERILGAESHIIPFIVGDAERAVSMSRQLLDGGFKVLPIRTPTVPPGTERLRISLSASLTEEEIARFKNCLNELR